MRKSRRNWILAIAIVLLGSTGWLLSFMGRPPENLLFPEFAERIQMTARVGVMYPRGYLMEEMYEIRAPAKEVLLLLADKAGDDAVTLTAPEAATVSFNRVIYRLWAVKVKGDQRTELTRTYLRRMTGPDKWMGDRWRTWSEFRFGSTFGSNLNNPNYDSSVDLLDLHERRPAMHLELEPRSK